MALADDSRRRVAGVSAAIDLSGSMRLGAGSGDSSAYCTCQRLVGLGEGER